MDATFIGMSPKILVSTKLELFLNYQHRGQSTEEKEIKEEGEK